MKGFVCKGCGFIPIDGRAPDKCPVCGAPKTAFEEKEDAVNIPKDPKKFSDYEKKHIPQITIIRECRQTENCLDVHVKIGEIQHPMDKDHFISRLDFYIDNEFVSRIILTPSKLNPAAGLHLKVQNTKISIIESCTKHGNWIGEINIS